MAKLIEVAIFSQEDLRTDMGLGFTRNIDRLTWSRIYSVLWVELPPDDDYHLALANSLYDDVTTFDYPF